MYVQWFFWTSPLGILGSKKLATVLSYSKRACTILLFYMDRGNVALGPCGRHPSGSLHGRLGNAAPDSHGCPRADRRPGFRFNAAKRRCSQRVVHLGLLVDTVDMSLGFDRSNSAVTRDTLIVYLRTLTEGQNISYALARRMADKLGWHAQVLQAGRTHIRTWWLYVSFGLNLLHPVRTVLISDTVWWIGVFNTWADSERPPQRFPILSGAVFQADPSRLQVLVSDAAGDDSMGYYSGRSCPTPRSTEPHRGTLVTVLARHTPASSLPWTTSSNAHRYPTASC